jgi:hypothetical protein
VDKAQIKSILEKYSEWQLNKMPASTHSIDHLVSQIGFPLPESYLTLLSLINGASGPLGIQPGWFQLWEAENVVNYNKGYSVHEDLPGYFGFGSNGGGELLAFRMDDGEPYKIYMIPFIPMEAEEAILIADCFDTFIMAMGEEFD